MQNLGAAPAVHVDDAATHRSLAGSDRPVVDIVVPVFNEERALEASIHRLHAYLTGAFPFSWRITIVDNASTDATWLQAQRLQRELPGVRARHLDRKGRGLALRSAWSASDADVVAYMDVDLSTDLDALLPLVAPLVSGHSDVAIGSRLAPGSHVARHPKRELISRSYNLILRTVLATRVRDAQCGFKAVRATVARKLLPAVEDDGWFFDTELLLLAERNGLRIHEVPVDWIDDDDSRVHVVSTAIGDLKGTARMAVRFATGGGRVELGPVERAPLANDFGRRFVAFSLIGLASTAVSLALFLLTHDAIGAIAANVVAVTATFVANAWANARYTERMTRPRWARSFALYAGSIVATTAALAVVDTVTTSLSVQVSVLVFTWLLAAVARVPRDRNGPMTVPTSIVQRMLRCFFVSVGTTLLSAAVLVALALGAGVPAGSANVIAVCCGIAPSYFANRQWAWGRTGRSDLWHEVVPFWLLSITGLVASTIAVAAVAHATTGWSTSARSIALPLANLAVFGGLWLVQFALLDQVLFKIVPNETVPKEHIT